MIIYTPKDWFWVVGGERSRAWSSALSAYTESFPSDRVTRIDTEENLTDVLAQYGLPGPVVRVPTSVTPYQARIALHQAGLLSAVEAAVASATVPAVSIAWQYAVSIDRNSPFISAIASTLGLTEEQIDALFVAASAVS